MRTLLSLYHHCKARGETVSLGLETSQGQHYLSFSLRTRNHQHHDLLQELSYSDSVTSDDQRNHCLTQQFSKSPCCLQYESYQMVL